MASCLTEEQLEELAQRSRGLTDGCELRAHVEACPSCRDRLAECRKNLAYLDTLKVALRDASAPGDDETDPIPPDGIDPLRDETLPLGSPAGPVTSARLDLQIPGCRIVREIHRGGQGVVYEALQFSTKRTVAVKMLLEGPFADDVTVERFRREVELIAGLKHPNIVTIHDSGVARGNHYFVMEFIRGLPLREYVRSRELSVRQIVELLAQVCAAVAFAHRHGVMHRDLKSSNILVDEDGCPHVLDFGLAKIIAEHMRADQEQKQLSRSGHCMGTLDYMSPEQTLGDSEAMDIRTDVYSLGVILYELLTGDLPYETKTDLVTAMSNIRHAIPRRPSKRNRKVGSEIDAIILQTLEKSADRRYQSAGELGGDLSAWLEGRPVVAKSASSLYVLRKMAVRYWYATAVVATLLLAIVAFSLVSLEFYFAQLEALKGQERSDRAFADAIIDRDDRVEAVRDLARHQALGWFLLAWRADSPDSARLIQARTPEGSPERTAMEFLMDETYSVERLLADIPAQARSIAYFAAAERHLKAGRRDAAIEALESCIGQPGSRWLRDYARARREELRSETIGVDTEGGGP